MPPKVSLKGIIVRKDDPKKLTTGAKIGIGAAVLGGAYLLSQKINKKKKKGQDVSENPVDDKPNESNLSRTPTTNNTSGSDTKGTSVWLWVGIGVGVIVLGTTAFFVLRKK